MVKEFSQLSWDAAVEADCRALVRLAIREDIRDGRDVTSHLLVASERRGQAELVARSAGLLAGLPIVAVVLQELGADVTCQPHLEDGHRLEPGSRLATLSGLARDILLAERLVLNLVGRLSGIATLTRRYVDAVAGLPARIYDTRKTTPGWRLLEKYSVRCGGGHNHRLGLYDAVLIKDNHLALVAELPVLSAGEAVSRARAQLPTLDPARAATMIVEVEVDTLEQLHQVLPHSPDIVLLDNMSLAELRQAVAARNAFAATSQLEASGGVNLATVHAIAATGVERISVGALTHSAVSLDVALDWSDTPK